MGMEPEVNDWEGSESGSVAVAPPVVETPPAAEPVVTAPVETPAEPPADTTPADPLAEDDRDASGRFSRRHRSNKQKASAEDVPRIKELTGKWRETEKQLKQQRSEYKKLQEELTALKTPKVNVPAAPAAFTDAEPKIDDFAEAADPYAAWVRAVAAYDRKKEAWEASKASHQDATTRQQEAQQAAEQQRLDAVIGTYAQRVGEFIKAKPDYQAVVSQADTTEITPVLKMALLTDDRGPEFVYTLAQRPDLYAEMLLVSDGKQVTDSSVALMRRLLAARMQAAPTRSAAPILTPAPKPPNLVRTGPMRPANDLPGDEASLEAHEAAFPARRGSHRR